MQGLPGTHVHNAWKSAEQLHSGPGVHGAADHGQCMGPPLFPRVCKRSYGLQGGVWVLDMVASADLVMRGYLHEVVPYQAADQGPILVDWSLAQFKSSPTTAWRLWL